jgi:hypothetical protein
LKRKKSFVIVHTASVIFLFEGTDLDIQTALIEAGNKISEVVMLLHFAE